MGVLMSLDGRKIDAADDMVEHWESMGWKRIAEDGTELPSTKEEQTANEIKRLDKEMKPVATIPEMRQWALDNGVEGVSERGKLPQHAIQAYREAHKE